MAEKSTLWQIWVEFKKLGEVLGRGIPFIK